MRSDGKRGRGGAHKKVRPDDGRGGAREGSGPKRAGGGRRRREISKKAALALRLLVWLSYGRTCSDEEEDEYLSALVLAERERQVAAMPPGMDEARWAGFLEQVERENDEEAINVEPEDKPIIM